MTFKELMEEAGIEVSSNGTGICAKKGDKTVTISYEKMWEMTPLETKAFFESNLK